MSWTIIRGRNILLRCVVVFVWAWWRFGLALRQLIGHVCGRFTSFIYIDVERYLFWMLPTFFDKVSQVYMRLIPFLFIFPMAFYVFDKWKLKTHKLILVTGENGWSAFINIDFEFRFTTGFKFHFPVGVAVSANWHSIRTKTKYFVEDLLKTPLVLGVHFLKRRLDSWSRIVLKRCDVFLATAK